MKLMVSRTLRSFRCTTPGRPDSRKLLHYDDDKARRDAEIIDAKVPRTAVPLTVSRAVCSDALKATGSGFSWLLRTPPSPEARKLSREELEGVDITRRRASRWLRSSMRSLQGKIEKDAYRPCSTSRAAAGRGIFGGTGCGISNRNRSPALSPTKTVSWRRSKRCSTDLLNNRAYKKKTVIALAVSLVAFSVSAQQPCSYRAFRRCRKPLEQEL